MEQHLSQYISKINKVYKTSVESIVTLAHKSFHDAWNPIFNIFQPSGECMYYSGRVVKKPMYSYKDTLSFRRPLPASDYPTGNCGCNNERCLDKVNSCTNAYARQMHFMFSNTYGNWMELSVIYPQRKPSSNIRYSVASRASCDFSTIHSSPSRLKIKFNR